MKVRSVLLAYALLALACVHHRGIPRQVAESAHRDYPECGGHDIDGHPIDEAAGTWAVDACGRQLTYRCPTGPNSRWHHCEQVGVTSGGAVTVAAPQ